MPVPSGRHDMRRFVNRAQISFGEAYRHLEVSGTTWVTIVAHVCASSHSALFSRNLQYVGPPTQSMPRSSCRRHVCISKDYTLECRYRTLRTKYCIARPMRRCAATLSWPRWFMIQPPATAEVPGRRIASISRPSLAVERLLVSHGSGSSLLPPCVL